MPSSITMLAPCEPCGLLAILRRDTMPMLAKASPRKPSDTMDERSSLLLSFEVACRSRAKDRSASAMPLPLSSMTSWSNPPRSTVITMEVEPASRLFSISSLTTCAGRSTTSPAAINPMVASSSCLILSGFMHLPPGHSSRHKEHPMLGED